MSKQLLFAALVVGAVSGPASAAIYSTDFSAIGNQVGGASQGDGSVWGVDSFSTGTPGVTWDASVGSFDYVMHGNSQYQCAGGSGGCIELGGSSGFGGSPSTPPSTVQFTLNLAAGSYSVSFDWSRQQYASGFDFMIGNNTVAQFPVQAPTGWSPFSHAFTVASAGNVTFSFVTGALPGNVGSLIDNVSVVPEPATWAMLLAGGLTVGLVARRRRGRGAAAIGA